MHVQISEIKRQIAFQLCLLAILWFLIVLLMALLVRQLAKNFYRDSFLSQISLGRVRIFLYTLVYIALGQLKLFFFILRLLFTGRLLCRNNNDNVMPQQQQQQGLLRLLHLLVDFLIGQSRVRLWFWFLATRYNFSKRRERAYQAKHEYYKKRHWTPDGTENFFWKLFTIPPPLCIVLRLASESFTWLRLQERTDCVCGVHVLCVVCDVCVVYWSVTGNHQGNLVKGEDTKRGPLLVGRMHKPTATTWCRRQVGKHPHLLPTLLLSSFFLWDSFKLESGGEKSGEKREGEWKSERGKEGKRGERRREEWSGEERGRGVGWISKKKEERRSEGGGRGTFLLSFLPVVCEGLCYLTGIGLFFLGALYPFGLLLRGQWYRHKHTHTRTRFAHMHTQTHKCLLSLSWPANLCCQSIFCGECTY